MCEKLDIHNYSWLSKKNSESYLQNFATPPTIPSITSMNILYIKSIALLPATLLN